MSIKTLYKVRIDIPEPVWEAFGYIRDVEQKIFTATDGNIEAGTCDTSNVFVWAIFTSLADAQGCEAKLLALVAELTQNLAAQAA